MKKRKYLSESELAIRKLRDSLKVPKHVDVQGAKRYCSLFNQIEVEKLLPQELALYAVSLFILSVVDGQEDMLRQAANIYEVLLRSWDGDKTKIVPDYYEQYLTVLMLDLQYEKLYRVALAGYGVKELRKAATIALSDTGLHLDGITSKEEYLKYTKEADRYKPPLRTRGR